MSVSAVSGLPGDATRALKLTEAQDVRLETPAPLDDEISEYQQSSVVDVVESASHQKRSQSYVVEKVPHSASPLQTFPSHDCTDDLTSTCGTAVNCASKIGYCTWL